MSGPLSGLRGWLAGRTSAQLSVAVAVLAALALSGSVVITGQAVRADQRQKAALVALADYATMVDKLGAQAWLGADQVTEADAAYFSAWLTAFQSGPSREDRTLEEVCRTGRGGAGVRFIRAPSGKPAGLAALEDARSRRLKGLGDDVYVAALPAGTLCPGRDVEVVVVKRQAGALEIIVGRVVDRSGEAWGRAVLIVGLSGLLILISGLTAAVFARHRLGLALAEVSASLDRAAMGDFSRRPPVDDIAPELRPLSLRVNRTLDRLEELLGWLRDSSDQLAHDFRTPLARATARLERLGEAATPGERARLLQLAGDDLRHLTRAMNETLALRDGSAWVFERVQLDELVIATAELYEPLADTRAVRLVTEVEPASVLGVRSLLQRALTNLVDNAVKFSPEGGVVTLRAHPTDTGVEVSIADQGPGMDPGRARGPVEDAVSDDPARNGVESHGMGLPFVRAVVRRHGGVLTIGDAGPGAIVTARFSR
ncbi:HAMP domain-containing sensor histidine kinase [Brevundimonas sp.]|uniref:HAMP domain-containing sensor histidine kinase n=1 Tax=Brevundimonas sp. TaxID=1871086 RepID=UPI001DA2D2B5|nr:HAMP domain-containing sensor histidine kinase [Brevundimonas sp.]MBL0947954.1 HAMP domain-containing histidine kinase [Brevundimonas sp.]